MLGGMMGEDYRHKRMCVFTALIRRGSDMIKRIYSDSFLIM
jgi:hypothetical protein